MTLHQRDEVAELARQIEPQLSQPRIDDIRTAAGKRRRFAQQRNFAVVCLLIVTVFAAGFWTAQSDQFASTNAAGEPVRPTLPADSDTPIVRPSTIPDFEDFAVQPFDTRPAAPDVSELEPFGGVLVVVPELSDVPLDFALDLLDTRDLRGGELVGSGDPTCLVTGSEPPAGSEVPFSTEIDLVLSFCNGAEETVEDRPETPQVIPDLADAPLIDSLTDLFELGFRLEIVEEPHPTIEIDRVIRTEPEAGEVLQAGEIVTIFLSDGPEEG